MTCIPIPQGKRVGFLCTGGPVHEFEFEGRVWRFEMHQWCGPMPLKKDGDPTKRGPGRKFWKMFEAWRKENQK